MFPFFIGIVLRFLASKESLSVFLYCFFTVVLQKTTISGSFCKMRWNVSIMSDSFTIWIPSDFSQLVWVLLYICIIWFPKILCKCLIWVSSWIRFFLDFLFIDRKYDFQKGRVLSIVSYFLGSLFQVCVLSLVIIYLKLILTLLY